uniref:ASH domain-containing protein n=1 Tax=Caenorhabditis tropicalis TaxID=1561998 RepID=A0A1I7T183_9PELO
MDEEAPMDLVDDHFDDCSIEDGPVDDNGSFYNPDAYDECVEEEVEPTSENFRVGRYKPSQHTPRELPTIREENREESRSNPGSRIATRPPSALSNGSNDFSGQFGFGGADLNQFTDNFFSHENRAERLFPENEFTTKAYISPVRDKQNSWEPSVCHYEKQPTPEVQNNSPGLIFANLSSRKEKAVSRPQNQEESNRQEQNLLEKNNDENLQTCQRISPEKNIFATSPLNSTKCFETKTSTPKRPGGTNRLGYRGLPAFEECSTIYEESPQRNSNSSRLFQSRQPTNYIIPNTTGLAASDSLLPNKTISESMIQKVLGGSKKDIELFNALEQMRKKREQRPPKPDFRLNANTVRIPSKTSVVQRQSSSVHSSTANPSHNHSSTRANEGQLYTQASHQKAQEVKRNSSVVSEITNSNTTNSTTNMSKISTARTDLSRTSRNRGGFSDSSVSTVVPNINSTTSLHSHRDGRDSVNSIRTVSRASSIMTLGGGCSQPTGATKPLRISAKRMAFGIVPLNETLTMELEVENVSDRQCQVRSKLDSSTSVMKILDNKLTIVDPKKSIKLRVAFTPTSVGRYQLLLSIEVPAQNFIQKIPVWGMSGIGNVAPLSKTLLSTNNPSEFGMYSPNMKRISFKLGNLGGFRDSFALVTVFDSAMRPIPKEYISYRPARGNVIAKQTEKEIEIRIDPLFAEHHDEDSRTTSAMSTASSMTATRRRTASGADFVVQVCWGEEILRQRLRLLESRTGRRQSIDSHDFTSHRFHGEDELRPPPENFPAIVIEDADLFASSYRTFYISVFSSSRELTAFRAATGNSMNSGSGNDTTILETTAFRHQTFFNDVTMMPQLTKRQ